MNYHFHLHEYCIKLFRFLDDTTTRLISEAESRFRDSPAEENARRFLPQLLSVESLSTKDKLTMIFDMMLAALDTTTYSLFRTLFLMAKNPETQVRNVCCRIRGSLGVKFGGQFDRM